MPRGLYAMVMAFKDQVPRQQSRGPLSALAGTLGKSLFSSELLDINQTVAKYSNPDSEMSSLKKGLQNMRLVNGKTHTEIELPEAAALVYPDLDRAVQNELSQAGKGKEAARSSTTEKLKGAGRWVQDYMDRKAQATFVSARFSLTAHVAITDNSSRRETTKAPRWPSPRLPGRAFLPASAIQVTRLTVARWSRSSLVARSALAQGEIS